MSVFDRQQAIKKLTEKNALLPCHRCGHKSFGIVDGVTSYSLVNDHSMIGSVMVGGPSLPVLHVFCENCGALTSHSLGILELLPKGEENGG
ncbi:hypothetical protein [Pantoea agglomerans]|uniref:hypothetical protein n=1 Tax=Enterobacter agglomerans TaxID=549 RepID=UPI0012DA4D74|nr:hypothetical protein [Pantoea agglomerans]WHU85134.1 hypothetical protein A7P61_09160 [Pantoea agglomerans pv. betae]